MKIYPIFHSYLDGDGFVGDLARASLQMGQPVGRRPFLSGPAPITGRKELGTRSDIAFWGDA
jgi:hypothetical protein